MLWLSPAAEELLGASAASIGRPLGELLAGTGSLQLTVSVADGGGPPTGMRIGADPGSPPIETERSRRRKRLLERAEELAGSGSWLWSSETGEIDWSDNLFRLFGLQPGDVEVDLDFVLDHVHPEDREMFAAHVDAAARTGVLPSVDARIVRDDGSVRHLRASGERHPPEQGGDGLVVGAAQDVTDERLADREVRAQVAVAEALAAWEAFVPGSQRLLEGLAGALGCSVSMLWIPERGLLARRSVWTDDRAGLGPAAAHALQTDVRLPVALGLAGAAATRRAPVALRDLPAGERSAVCRSAAAAGLAGGLAIPAMTPEEVLGVIELRSAEPELLTDRLARSLTGLSYQLGAFLAGRRGQLWPSPLTPRELEVLRLAATGLTGPGIADRLVVSPATVKTHLEHIYAKLGVPDRASAVAYGIRQGLIE